MDYSTSGFNHIETVHHPDGLHKDVVYVCEMFTYSARCFQDIIQFIRGQRPEELLIDGTIPTDEQLSEHDSRREFYNQNHEPLQIWIDNLS